MTVTAQLRKHAPTPFEPEAGSFNLLELLLAEQTQMSAVDQFARWHDSTTAMTAAYQALLPASALKEGQQYAFEVDLDACSGCKACVVACHTLNGLDEDETWRKVGLLTSTSSTLPIVKHVTTACHHCIEPGCLSGCPVLAYEKDPLTGIVRHLDDQCFGCKYCLMMCPYEVPQYNASLGIVRKCDMCAGRLELGEAPACVQACPNQAIRITVVDAAKFSSTVHGGERLLSVAPLSHLTQPTTQFLSKLSVDHHATNETRLTSRESATPVVQPGHEPLVVMLVLSQASVGLWLVLLASFLFELRLIDSVLAPSVAASILGIVGVHAALLHLGRPWLAFRSFLGWRRSWLSREAILFGLFLGAAFSATTSSLLQTPNSLIGVAFALTAITGCAAVYCSSMIYIATQRELWSASRTLLEFFATTGGLGLALASLFARDSLSANMLGCGVVGCAVAFAPKLLDWHAGSRGDVYCNDFSALSGRLLRGNLRLAFRATVATLLLAVLLTSLTALIEAGIARTTLATGTVIALFASQFLTRWLYFASVVFARMPGAST